MIESIIKLVTVASGSQLALAAFLSIAVAGLCYYFFRDQVVWARLLAFFGVLIFAFLLSIRLIVPPTPAPTPASSPAPNPALVQQPAAGQQPINPLNLLRLIKLFPPGERMAKCMLVETAPNCTILIDAIADLTVAVAPAPLQARATEALTARVASPAFVAEVARLQPRAADTVYSIGAGNGWNVDVFWCQGINDGTLLARGKLVANALSSKVGADIGGGTVVGRIRLRGLATGFQGNGYPSTGLLLRAEASADEQRAADSIIAYLSTASGMVFAKGSSKTRTPRYLSVFVCS